MIRTLSFAAIALNAKGQQVGTNKQETHLAIPLEKCTGAGCSSETASLTLDANWRWLHSKGGYTNCYDGDSWSSSFCSDPEMCTEQCALEGVPQSDWSSTYGVEEVSGGVKLGFKRGSNVGSRMYVMESETKYKMFKLKNKEFSFDVDVSNLPCGINGAFYLVEMEEDGGKSSTNLAGAKYGTGYCDAQCPQDIKFIKGEANSKDWHLSPSGRAIGHYGACCAEMDLWEANSVSAAVTPHPCKIDSFLRCEGATCEKDATCDSAGCDFNSWRLGDHNYFGKGSSFKVDTSKPFTVVTQFVTSDGTDAGDLVEIRRHYVQDGKVIDNSQASLPGLSAFSSLTDGTCAKAKETYGENNAFANMGGMKQMGAALGRGMVLVLSVWDDKDDHMLWLDSNEPKDASPDKPGVSRGPCPITSGNPSDVRSRYANADVSYMNLKYGEIGSTAPGVPGPHPTPSPGPTPPPAPGCTDNSPYCGFWAQSGECQKNPGYMSVVCKLSCNACHVAIAALGGNSSSLVV